MSDPMDLALGRLYAMDAGQPQSSLLANMTFRDIKHMAAPKSIFTVKTAAPAIAAAAAVMAIGLGPRVLHGTSAPGGSGNTSPCVQTPAPSPSASEGKR